MLHFCKTTSPIINKLGLTERFLLGRGFFVKKKKKEVREPQV